MTDARHIFLSSARQDWVTPDWFVRLVSRVGRIELDPATTLANPVGAERVITQAYDWHPPLLRPRLVAPCGLSSPWTRAGLAFVNSPYGPQLSGPVQPERPIWRTRNGRKELVGVGRGWAARIAQEEGETLALVPARTETTWWRLLYGWCDWACFWSSPEHGVRISFVDPDTGEARGGSNLASTVFYRGPRGSRFRSVFEPHGEVVPGRTRLRGLLQGGARSRRLGAVVEQLDVFRGPTVSGGWS